MISDDDLWNWLQKGIEAGWIGTPRCYFHDGFDTTEEEEKEITEGYDPCIVLIRLWD